MLSILKIPFDLKKFLTRIRPVQYSVHRWMHPPQTNKIKYKAYLLTSQNIYENLAFENWLYSNENFGDVNLMLLWRSKPCVVIGRHQNPWVECDVYQANKRKIDIARRYSGGGTVFHDLGNLNCSFFTSRSDYDRTQNSQLIVDALKKNWDLDVGVASVRDDIFLESFYKISGSSSKLGPSVAYHHCTLLFDVDKDLLSSILHTNLLGLKSNATESVRSRVKNLSEVNQGLTYESLTRAIGEVYLGQGAHNDTVLEVVDPTSETLFPGIGKMSDELKTWSMIYERTPKFSVGRTFSQKMSNQSQTLKLHLEVEKGLVKSVELHMDRTEAVKLWFAELESQLVGSVFLWDAIEHKLRNSLSAEGVDQDYVSWVIECIQRLFTLR
ncbi:lipoyl amidotransferase LIPT1, mitochondrial-like isoform X1 [Lineus longissimus]|uniref:lipoyl amidotransferase LIPT1, mitochondrial-like isoform X1 n=1 Tax=Lineus longissimus TaxID=88925 RepID=UPI002B4D538A